MFKQRLPFDPVKGWLCKACDDYHPKEQFKTGRWICKKQYNEQWHKAKLERWKKYPAARKAAMAWQVAYRDSVKLFKTKVIISEKQALELGAERLMPRDPTQDLSETNCIAVSIETRKRLCKVWRQSRSVEEYAKHLN